MRTIGYSQRTMGRDKNLPVSVAEYLFNLHEHMEHTTKLASERNDEAKKKYKMWYNQSTTECLFEGGNYITLKKPLGLTISNNS